MEWFSFNYRPTFLSSKSANTERKHLKHLKHPNQRKISIIFFTHDFSYNHLYNRLCKKHKSIEPFESSKDKYIPSSVKTQCTNSYNNPDFYKITQNIRNGYKLTKQEIRYIENLHKNDLIELIMVFDECTQCYTEMIKSLL